MIMLIAAGAALAVFLILYILDRLNVIHIFIRGKPSGIAANTFRAMQGFTEMNASRAQEVIRQEEEGKDKAQDKSGENALKHEH